MIHSSVKFVAKTDPVAWPDLSPDNSVIGSAVSYVCLDKGMESGKPSVAIRVDIPGGKSVIVETSAALFTTAARAIMARYPEFFG